MKMHKRVLAIIMSVLLLNTVCSVPLNAAAADSEATLKTFDDVREKDLSTMNFVGKSDLLFTLTFDNLTKWPSKDKMPADFDPQKLLEAGKKPGLGIQRLQEQGYTGTGITIAYVDQNLLLNHDAYKNVNLHNYMIQSGNPSMHGPAVLSLLAGKESGIVPNAEVYFFGHNGMKDDNEYEARAFEKIIEINKTLPENKKIKIVGMSHGADDTLSVEYAKHLREAQEKARKSGIIVVDVLCGMATVGVQGFKDRDDYKNYQLSEWESKFTPEFFNNNLLVPSDFRTTAVGYKNMSTQYAYWGSGGFSWGVPYITGVITMGLQIDPKLTEKEAFSFLHESAYKHLNGDFINPEGFIKLVKQNLKLKNGLDYYYILYNRAKTSSNDTIAINDYADRLSSGGSVGTVKLDISVYKSAPEILTAMKEASKLRKGKLLGVQIFGSEEEVPAFNVHFKVEMLNNQIDDSGNFNSDFFYSNFNSDVKQLSNDVSIYKTFKEKLNVSFVPSWKVSRLPLKAGEIAPFINKYYDFYSKQANINLFPVVNFSSPIFPDLNHSDDMGYFLRERLDKEFHILNDKQYRLYANKKGLYPVTTKVNGELTRENMKLENQKQVVEFFTNSHGQWDNIDQTVFVKDADVPADRTGIRDVTKKGNGISEERISFLNTSSINSVLNKNYYYLTMWECSTAYDLKSNTLVHEALAKGKAVNVFAASSIISNNGVNNKASLNEMKKNNFYYFFYNFYKNLSLGKSRSDSFYLAMKAYSEEILKNTNLLGEGNYGFNLHNVLSYHNLGLLEYPRNQNKGQINLPTKDNLPVVSNSPTTSSTGRKDFAYFTDNGLKYENIKYRTSDISKDYTIKGVNASADKGFAYLKLNYTAPSTSGLNVFLQGDTPGLKETYPSGTKQGENTVIIKFSKEELLSYKAGLAIFIGKGNFIFVEKGILINLISKAAATN